LGRIGNPAAFSVALGQWRTGIAGSVEPIAVPERPILDVPRRATGKKWSSVTVVEETRTNPAGVVAIAATSVAQTANPNGFSIIHPHRAVGLGVVKAGGPPVIGLNKNIAVVEADAFNVSSEDILPVRCK
jgi:hypothetical protein